jgi:hypothetical protein
MLKRTWLCVSSRVLDLTLCFRAEPLHQAGRDIQREADSQIAVVLDSFAKMFSSFQESGRDMRWGSGVSARWTGCLQVDTAFGASSLMEQMVRLVQTEQTALEKHWDVFDEQNKRRLVGSSSSSVIPSLLTLVLTGRRSCSICRTTSSSRTLTRTAW